MRNRFLAVEAQHNQLDNTVWSKEMLAEKYEDVFIKLWDDLRKTDDEFEILQAFPFTELTLETPASPQEVEHGIKWTRYGSPAQKMAPDQWRQFLAERKKDGYRIEQTEWRQPQFDFYPDSPAQSVMNEYPEHQRMRAKMAFGNRMYFASDKGFRQRPAGDQVARSGWSWGATSFDFDNDGDLDIYVVNGHKSRETARDYERQFWRHYIYAASSKHDPVMDIYFQSMGSKLEIGYLMGLASELDCRNVVADDLDADGKPDLLMTTFEVWPREQQGLHLFQNRWTETGNWIGVRLREHGAGYSPVGAKVTVVAAGKKQSRQFVTGDSHRSQQANTAHFGLGKSSRVDSIEVRWPNGVINRVSNPGINRYYDLTPK
ncbi:MAG: CRTAC1 family protein [Verrucomicrobiota bacterium]